MYELYILLGNKFKFVAIFVFLTSTAFWVILQTIAEFQSHMADSFCNDQIIAATHTTLARYKLL